ncbi:MAG: helix-turn-helix domain-containing protein [Deltaproteobacteria bacterium]|nr:helix-turn-helix domain-containing protein [Deltaproteobacteria bacterium]
MKRCPSCGEGRLRKGTARHSLAVGGHRFGGSLPALVCATCEESFVSAQHLGTFELGAAMMLASSGQASPDVFRFMRKTVGLRAADLAELLDVKPETVSRWENGHLPVEGRAFALLAGIVRDRLGAAAGDQFTGRDDTEALLRAVRKPAKVRRAVKLGGVSVRSSPDRAAAASR